MYTEKQNTEQENYGKQINKQDNFQIFAEQKNSDCPENNQQDIVKQINSNKEIDTQNTKQQTDSQKDFDEQDAKQQINNSKETDKQNTKQQTDIRKGFDEQDAKQQINNSKETDKQNIAKQTKNHIEFKERNIEQNIVSHKKSVTQNVDRQIDIQKAIDKHDVRQCKNAHKQDNDRRNNRQKNAKPQNSKTQDTEHYHIEFMKKALELAKIAAENGDVPVGCVIVRDGKIIAEGYNRRQTDKNAVSHAETEAISSACRLLGGWRLPGCSIYVTLEPCPMCAGAIINARIPEVYIAARDSKSGAFGSVLNLRNYPLNHKPDLHFGIMETESADLLRDFFRKLR